MTYFLNKTLSLDPGPASGLTGGIRTRAEGFWARWQMSSLRSNLMWEDENAREGAEHQLAEQLRPRLTEQPGGWAYGFIRRAPADMDRQVIAAARREAETNPEAWSDVDLSEDGINAEALRRRRATLETLQMDAALAPQPSFVGELLTQMAAETLSPRVLPALVVGGGAGGSLLRVAAREAAVNVGVTAALIPEQFEASDALGLPRPNVAGELGEAALFGAVFGVGFEALGRGLRYGRELTAPRVEGRTALEAELETERAVAALQGGPEAISALREAQPIIGDPRRLAVPEWAAPDRFRNDLRSTTAIPSPAAMRPVDLRSALANNRLYQRARDMEPEAFAALEASNQRIATLRGMIEDLSRQGADDVQGILRNMNGRIRQLLDEHQTARARDKGQIMAQIREIETDRAELRRAVQDGYELPEVASARSDLMRADADRRDLAPTISEVLRRAREVAPDDPPSAPAQEPEPTWLADAKRMLEEEIAAEAQVAPRVAQAYAAARPTARGEPAPAPYGGSVDAVRSQAFGDPASAAAENVRAAVAAELRAKIERDGDFPVLDDDGQMRSASSVLEEMDREDAFLARIDLCGMGP